MTLHPTNQIRADRIAASLRFYKSKQLGESGHVFDEEISSFLSDLRHYCDREGFDFAVLDRIAYRDYIEENGVRATGGAK